MRDIRPEELSDFSECFLTGTAAEVTPVGEIDDLEFTVGDITQWMMEDYDKVVGKADTDAQSAAE